MVQQGCSSTPWHPTCTDFITQPLSAGNAGGGEHLAEARAGVPTTIHADDKVGCEVRGPSDLYVVPEFEPVRGAVLSSHCNAEGVVDAECRAVAPTGSRDGRAGAPLISSGRLAAGFTPTSTSRNSSSTCSQAVVGSSLTASSSSTTPYLPTPAHHRTDHGVSDSFVAEANSTETSTEKAHVTNEVGAKVRPILVHLYDDENGI